MELKLTRRFLPKNSSRVLMRWARQGDWQWQAPLAKNQLVSTDVFHNLLSLRRLFKENAGKFPLGSARTHSHSMSRYMLFWWPPIRLSASQSNRPKSPSLTPLMVNTDLPWRPRTSKRPSWLWRHKHTHVRLTDRNTHTQSRTNKSIRLAVGGRLRLKKGELIVECVGWHFHPSDCSAGFTLNERFVIVCELTRRGALGTEGADYSFYCMFTWPAVYLQKKKVTSILSV